MDNFDFTENRDNKILRNWDYTIPDGPHKGMTLWSGRYCCTVSFVFCRINGKWCVLANQRGTGAEDNVGLWNSPCGFLECSESGQYGAARETFEETTIKINPKKMNFTGVQTIPYVNVTLQYYSVLNSKKDDTFIDHNDMGMVGGEKDEVADIKWIPLKHLNEYNWAYGHQELIRKIWKKIPFRKKLMNL